MPLDVPLNLPDVNQNVKISSDACCLKMKKLWGHNKKDDAYIDEFANPTVYFSFPISCDKDPEDLGERMSNEWIHLRGEKLLLKELTSFMMEMLVAVYVLWNNGHE